MVRKPKRNRGITMNISSLHTPQSNLDRLALSANRSTTDPKQYEGFTVKVGAESSPDGILGGVLSQQDYDKFMSIVKDVNVMNASYDEMSGVWRKLIDEKLLPDTDRGLHVHGYITGSKEFDSSGRAINTDAKYNQMEYQRTVLPGYADKECHSTRPSAIDGFKVIAAIANASPKTGEVIAKDAFSLQERSGPGAIASASSESTPSKPLVQLSSRGQQLARDEAQLALIPGLEKKDKDDDGADEISRLARLLESAKIQNHLDKNKNAAQSPDADEKK